MSRPRPTPGVDHWKNGQPTNDNPTYGGAQFVEGKGWCNSQGQSLQMKTEYSTSNHPEHQQRNWENPNIPPGYKLVSQGVPCPMRGSENGVVYYEVKGKTALWDNGNVYMVPEK